MMKAIFIAGVSCLLLAVCGIEGGAFTLAQGVAVGVIGSICSIGTINNIDWFK